ncbi:MAG: hypothetical protein K2N82_08750, partial [Lachnospiraceae bacterium]|nr:hypothetical protein [Lachnospiraceae bacterium]
VIGCGYCLPKIRLKVDLSYSMFLYHWIVLNIIVHFNLMNKLPWYVAVLLFLVGTAVAAMISWRLNYKLISSKSAKNMTEDMRLRQIRSR